MNYYDDPQPALIIAQSRSGSTFLCHCLDSHLQICCERGGPFDTHFNKWHTLGVSHRDLARVLWQRRGYQVSAFKITQRQFKNGYVTLGTVREFQPKIIYLHRLNVLKALISSELATAFRDGKGNHPIHSYKQQRQQSIKLDCSTLVNKIDDYLQRTETTIKALSEFDLLALNYEEITRNKRGLQKPIGLNICEFLNVPYKPMASETIKVNSKPIITNLDKVTKTLKGTGHEWMLE